MSASPVPMCVACVVALPFWRPVDPGTGAPEGIVFVRTVRDHWALDGRSSPATGSSTRSRGARGSSSRSRRRRRDRLPIELFPTQVWDDYVRVTAGVEGWESILDRWGVTRRRGCGRGHWAARTPDHLRLDGNLCRRRRIGASTKRIRTFGEREPRAGPARFGAMTDPQLDVVVLGGGGHVGLPLSLAFADAGLRVGSTTPTAPRWTGSPRARCRSWRPAPTSCSARCCRPAASSSAPTPSDRADRAARRRHRHAGRRVPRPSMTSSSGRSTRSRRTCATASSSCCAARSTRARPATFASVSPTRGCSVDVAFCPERIAEGQALEELYSCPQIVGADDDARRRPRRRALPASSPSKTVRSTTKEAELAKLFTNTWRYIKFAAANQFFMIANDFGLDFERPPRRSARTTRAPPTCPGPGFAAGPCLFKDTMQLAAFNNNNFTLGHASMMINEGLPLYLVAALEQRFGPAGHDRRHPRHGVQGRVRRHPLEPQLQAASSCASRPERGCSAPTPTCTRRPTSSPLDEVLERERPAGRRAPHKAYRDLRRRRHGVVDIWNAGRRASGCDARASRVVIPRLQRGRAHRRVPRPALRRGHAALRGARRRTTRPTTRRVPTSRSTRGDDPRCADRSTRYGRGPAARSASASTSRPRRSSSSRWPTAATTPSRSTSSPASSSAAWWSPPPRRYMHGGQQVGGPSSSAVVSVAGCRSTGSPASGTHDAPTRSTRRYGRREVGSFEACVRARASSWRPRPPLGDRLPVAELADASGSTGPSGSRTSSGSWLDRVTALRSRCPSRVPC